MSLQAQLKQLGTADLRGTSAASLKNKASFLFSARQAADQDLDTIYAIAYNGIMELVNLDDRFAPFEKTLFSETMKSVDRVLQVIMSRKVDSQTFFFIDSTRCMAIDCRGKRQIGRKHFAIFETLVALFSAQACWQGDRVAAAPFPCP